MARKRNRFINQAALEALVRFGPELSGLKELQREAIREYATGIKQAHGAARGIVGTIDQARPGVRKIYDDAGVSASKHASMLSGDVAQLPGVANSIKAGAQLEGTHALAALRDAQSAALTDLQSRRVAAKEGEAFAVQRAHTELVDSLAKVLGRKQDLRREQGAFTALTARELRTAAQDRADKLRIEGARIKTTQRGQTLSHKDRVAAQGVTKRGQDLTHQDAVAKNKKKGKGKSGYGPNGQTPEAHDKFASSVENMVRIARPWAKHLTRAQIVAKLTKGRPALSTPVAGGGRASLPAIKPMPADLRMSVALDIATSGYVGGRTIRRMRSRGWSVAQMGLPTKPPRSVCARRRGCGTSRRRRARATGHAPAVACSIPLRLCRRGRGRRRGSGRWRRSGRTARRAGRLSGPRTGSAGPRGSG
jgi:hypothetical protein